MNLSISGKATGRMWIGMDSTAIYSPNRRNRYEVLAVVGRLCGVTFDQIVSESRIKQRVRARQLAAYFLRVCTTLSFNQIGSVIGERDHSTIFHAVERIRHRAHHFEPELTEISVALGVVAPHPPPICLSKRTHICG